VKSYELPFDEKERNIQCNLEKLKIAEMCTGKQKIEKRVRSKRPSQAKQIEKRTLRKVDKKTIKSMGAGRNSFKRRSAENGSKRTPLSKLERKESMRGDSSIVRWT